MKKKKSTAKNTSVGLLASALLAFFVIVVAINTKTDNLRSSESSKKSVSNELITHESKYLKTSFKIPANWKVVEDVTYIDLVYNNNKINVSRNGTNFSDISGYLDDFDSKRNIKIKSERTLTINGHDVIERMEILNGGPVNQQKVYYIYADNWVYSLSTDSEELFADLDRVAQSFRYTP